MGKEFEVLAGLMAVQMRLVPGARFIQAAAQCESDPSTPLTRRLVEDHVLREAEMASIRMIVDAQIRQHGGDEGAALAGAPLDPKVLEDLLDSGPSPKLRNLLRMLLPGEKIGTLVVTGNSPRLSLLDTSGIEDLLGGASSGPAKPLLPAAVPATSPEAAPATAADFDSAEAVDERRANRALKAYVSFLAESQKGKGFHAKAMTRGVSESNVTALGSDETASREVQRKAASFLEASRLEVEEAVARWPESVAIRRSVAEFYSRAAGQREIEGNAEGASAFKARSRLFEAPGQSTVRRSGSLNVLTRAFPCACVRDGRDFPPEALVHRGLSLLTGLPAERSSARAGGASGGAVHPVRVKAHGPECVALPLPGAHVWLFRYDLTSDSSRLTTPDDVAGQGSAPLPTYVRDAVFAKRSPHLPEGTGVYLGTTPVEGVVLPTGSWMLVVWQAGRNPARVPVRTGLTGDTRIEVTLSLPTEVPPRFAWIAEGAFLYQGDVKNPHSEPVQAGLTSEYLLARYPVTTREYAEFLNARAKSELDFVVRRSSPRDVEKGIPLWPGPPFVVPTAQVLASASPEFRVAAKKLPGCSADWSERWPIVSISWQDAMLFCEWKRSTTGWLMALPHEIEWEKAARGVDGRTFPWGQALVRGACNTISVKPESASPAGVEEFPVDESPYGVFGLGGNTRDMCLNEPGPEFAGQRVMRGGYWASDGLRCHSSYRTCSRQEHVSSNGGFRMMCLTRIAGPEAGTRGGGNR